MKGQITSSLQNKHFVTTVAMLLYSPFQIVVMKDWTNILLREQNMRFYMTVEEKKQCGLKKHPIAC